MRQVAVTEGDKVEAQVRLGVAVNGYGVGDLAAAVAAVSEARIDALLAAYEEAYDLAPELRAGGGGTVAREAARIEAGLRRSSTGAASVPSRTLRGPRGPAQLPGIAGQRLMADGYGFGAEGDWKTAALLRIVKVIATGLRAAPRSWRTTPTT